MKTFLPPFHNFFRAFYKLSHAVSVPDLPLLVGAVLLRRMKFPEILLQPILNQVPTLFNPFSLVFIGTVHIGQKVKDLKEFFESDINDRGKDFQRLSEFGRRRQ